LPWETAYKNVIAQMSNHPLEAMILVHRSDKAILNHYSQKNIRFRIKCTSVYQLGIKTYEMDRGDTAEISRQQSGIAGIATEKID